MEQFNEDKVSAATHARQLATWYLNPLTKYWYNPGAWSVTRGGVHWDSNTPGVRLGKFAFNQIANKFKGGTDGAAFDNPLAKYGISDARYGRAQSVMGKINSTKLPTGYVGLSPSGSSKLFGVQMDGKSGPTSYIDDLVEDYMNKGQALSYKEFRSATKGKFNAAGKAKLGIDSKVSYGKILSEQYSLYKHQTTFENLSINDQKRIVLGRMASVDEQIKRAESKAVAYTRNGTAIQNTKNGYKATSLRAEKAAGYKQLWGLRAKGAKLGLGRLAVRGVVAVGKLNAYYQTASMMFQAAQMIWNPVAQGAVRAVDTAFQQFNDIASPDLGGKLNMSYMSQGAATERQRAVQAISKSRINGRSALGSEARLMHR